MTVRITEADLARDVRAALARVEGGDELLIEQEDHRAVAVLRAPSRSGRPVTEILEEAKRRNSTVRLDENFGVRSRRNHRQPPAAMAFALVGLVLDSSTVIAAERSKQSVSEFIESILHAHGPIELSLSPVTVAELAHGIFRAKTVADSQTRRLFVEDLLNLIPVHIVSK